MTDLSGTNLLAFNKTGTGTLTLTGDNTYSAGTTISAGTLQIGNGSASGSISGDVLNNGALAFDYFNVQDVASSRLNAYSGQGGIRINW